MSAASFEAAVLPHTPLLRVRARQFVRSSDCEDLVQETLLRAWRAWGKAEIGNVWGWLWLIMRNTFLDTRGRDSRWQSVVEVHGPEIAELRATPPRSPDANVTAGPDDDLMRAVRSLTGVQRTVVELQLLGVDDEITARHLKVKLHTVHSTSEKARRRLRAAL